MERICGLREHNTRSHPPCSAKLVAVMNRGLPRVEVLSDEELLRLTPTHPAAFDAFYRRHERFVLGFLRARTRSAETAIDLTAETFVAALVSASRYSPSKGVPVAWLLGIARNKLLRSLERGRVEDRARRRLGMARVEVDDDDLARVDMLAEHGVEELLAALPATQAAAVRGRVVEELPYTELAARLRCSELVARKRVSRGLAALRVELEGDR